MLVLLWALSRSGRNPDLQTALWRAHHRLCCQQLDANIQTRSVYIIHTLLLYLYNIYIIHNILLYRHHQHAGLFVGVMTRSHRHYPTAYSGCRDRSRFQLEGANIQTRSDQWWCMHIITCSDPQCIYNIYIYIYIYIYIIHTLLYVYIIYIYRHHHHAGLFACGRDEELLHLPPSTRSHNCSPVIAWLPTYKSADVIYK